MPEQIASTWGPIAVEVIISLVGLLLLSLRGAINKAFDAWAGNQTEQQDAARILKLKAIVDDGLETVQSNVFAELEADVRAALADGKLDDEERAKLRTKISEYARTTLADKGIEAAKEVYDVADEKLDDWLANRVEGRVVGALLGG